MGHGVRVFVGSGARAELIAVIRMSFSDPGGKKRMRYARRLPVLLISRFAHLYGPECQRLRPLSYSKSHVILIAFSVDTPDSLENVEVKVRLVTCASRAVR